MIDGILTPIIPVRFKFLDNETKIWEGIVDTGSTDILINKDISNYLGLQLNDWRTANSASGNFNTALATVNITIGHARTIEKCGDVNIKVSEKINYPKLPLIGKKPLFDWYNVYFNNEKKRCELTSIK